MKQKTHLLFETNIVFLSKGNSLESVDPLSIASIGDTEKNPYGNTCLTSPQGLKLILPQRMVELEVAPNRVVISDKKGLQPSESDLIENYTSKFIQISPGYTFFKYGFNYVIEMGFEKEPKFISENISKLAIGANGIERQALSLFFKVGTILYGIVIESILYDAKKYRITLNCEHDEGSFDLPKVTKHYLDGYAKLQEVLNAL